MIAAPLVAVRCAVCGGEDHQTVCPAREVEAHLEYLRLFHRRRLRAGPDGKPPRSALADRAEFTQDYATDIVACRGCGLLFRNPRPTAEAIARAYAQDTYGHQRLASLFEGQVELYRPKARILRRWLRPGAETRIVEVGSFVGGFLAAGREYGWDLVGVDPGEEVDSFCAERGLRVFRGTLAEAPLHPGTVDCVAIWNAFDQLPEPEPVLTVARRLLRPGGLLALRVPNGACFRLVAGLNRRWGSRLGGWLRAAAAWNNLLAFPYLHGYTLRTLDWLLSWHGLERIAATPDTLPRLSDAQTRPWAAWEERLLKGLCRTAARLDAAVQPDTMPLAPWFDAYYRVAA
jgi:SAM-dependent methyltransferase